MGTLSGDGYYQELDEDRFGGEDFVRGMERDEFDRQLDDMIARFSANGKAEMGATIGCACCGRLIVKRHYQQRFCPPVIKGRRKSYRCKDRFHNLTNPRGLFSHLKG